MTVKLLAQYQGLPAQSLYTGTDEAILLATSQATTDLEGATGLAAFNDLQTRTRQPNALKRQSILLSNRGSIILGAPTLLPGGFDLTGGTFTFCNCVPIPAPFYAWRPIFCNWLAQTWQIAGVAFRASSTANDYTNPTGSGTWLYNTMANAGALGGANNDLLRDGATSLGGATGYPFTVPASSTDPITGSVVPTFVAGDWNYVSPQTPSSGLAYYLMVRTLVVNQLVGGAAQLLPSGYSGQAINEGFDYFAGTKAGDFVTTIAAGTAAATATTAQPLIGIQFLTGRGVVNMGVEGDSHPAGLTTSANIASYVVRAANQLSKDTGVAFTPANAAWSGADSGRFWPTANTLPSTIKQKIFFVQSWTANDTGVTQADGDRMFARVLATAQRVREQGGVPILMCPFPRDANTMSQTGRLFVWQYLRQRCLDAASGGAFVVDASSLLGFVDQGTYRPGMSSDNIHPNDAGIYAILPEIKRVVRLASNF